ncbi:endonuclease V isoform X2 [Homo sapiens]|nr:endonuclease V isoform X2 [Homo sapiens]|eukprot:XP_011522958.1 endonuclease V isoform X2 [Homo sapiens]
MALEAAGGPPEETLSLWKREQARLKAHVVDRDTEAWQRDPAFSGLQRVGGVDVSFVKGDSVRACASLVVLSFPELEVVYEESRMVSLTAPYVSGFLAFREVPFLLELVQQLREKEPGLMPQVLLVDGNGVLHHRGFGVACHLGVLTDLPCVGVAKKLLQVDGLENNALHKEKIRLLQTRGDSFPLLGDSGTVLGMPTGQPSPSLSQALRSHDRSTRPLYISVGHRMSLEAAVRLTCCCCRFRIPEPVRQVHLLLCSRRSWESTDGVSVGLLSPWLRAGPSWWPHGHRRCGAPGCQVQALLPGQAGPLQGKADICSREHIRKSLGLPGPPTPRSPKAQRPVACPKGDSGESSGGAPSPQRQADRTTPGGRRSTAQHQVGQR